MTCASARASCGGIFDFDTKANRLIEVNQALEDPAVWTDAKRAQELGREKKALEDVVATLGALEAGQKDALELFAMARDEDDEATLEAIESDTAALRATVEAMQRLAEAMYLVVPPGGVVNAQGLRETIGRDPGLDFMSGRGQT